MQRVQMNPIVVNFSIFVWLFTFMGFYWLKNSIIVVFFVLCAKTCAKVNSKSLWKHQSYRRYLCIRLFALTDSRLKDWKKYCVIFCFFAWTTCPRASRTLPRKKPSERPWQLQSPRPKSRASWLSEGTWLAGKVWLFVIMRRDSTYELVWTEEG